MGLGLYTLSRGPPAGRGFRFLALDAHLLRTTAYPIQIDVLTTHIKTVNDFTKTTGDELLQWTLNTHHPYRQGAFSSSFLRSQWPVFHSSPSIKWVQVVLKDPNKSWEGNETRWFLKVVSINIQKAILTACKFTYEFWTNIHIHILSLL